MAAPNVDEVSIHVTKFLGILKSSQTQEFHGWNSVAMRRAWDWAKFISEAVEHLDDAAKSHLNNTFRFDGVPSLSFSAEFTMSVLEQAPHEFVRAVVCSPYLVTHPLRSEIVQCVVSYYPQLPQHVSSDANSTTSSTRLFADITTRLNLTRSTSVLMRIANMLTQSQPPLSVRLGSRELLVPSHAAWRSHPETLHMLALALSFQRQVLAQAAHDRSSASYLAQVAAYFNDSAASRDSWSMGKSVVAQAALLDWPDKSPWKQRLLDVVQVAVADTPTRLLELSPWLAGDLCRSVPSLAMEYVPCLLAYSGANNCPPAADVTWPHVTLDERLGCLVAASPNLTAFCESCLARPGLLEPC
ncbi:hypothetical protein, variant [Aphanomyces astaci]|uniref:Uncharacterized protein n=1 Tax=Aphanomyces astaci TaxID=112090 RepID=W4FXM0_APHAT|nr:hypothetical protein, variant [Aphanomyces astaci]ETV71696.1 hypothetical protein, variant [Aphanomyces astaci]|eukprot:XP_009838884.1 hypothetical protein, variant [Aphanomyces astaci]